MKTFEKKRCAVIGGAGFIGSHIVDRLIALGSEVIILDNLSCSAQENINVKADLYRVDIRDYNCVLGLLDGIDYVFHTAALARTPWCIDDPLLCYETNVMGTLHVLEAARQNNVSRVVVSSSNVVLAFDTPYRTSKEAVERLVATYNAMYGQSCIALRYSNVYGPRQLETGPSPNVFAALRKSKKEKGYLILTGDGTQSRDYTHVSDIVEGNLLAALSGHKGTVDLCTGINTSLNDVARYFKCPVQYTSPRPGDVLHIVQDPKPAEQILGWKARVKLEEGINDVLA